MKENKYDEQAFFEKYSSMPRSKDGLIAAGEWETLRPLLPNFNGKRVLDIGCGFGWHCIYASKNGAGKVVGIDISSKMLEIARQKTMSDKVSYQCMAIEDMCFEPQSFDVVLSSLAFHYIEDLDSVFAKINRYLVVKGRFIFSCEHPIFTSQGLQQWQTDENGVIVNFPVDNYFYEGKREAIFLDDKVIKYHKTLTTYFNLLLNNGFSILSVVEPKPTLEMLAKIEGMKDEMRRPMMLIISAVKN